MKALSLINTVYFVDRIFQKIGYVNGIRGVPYKIKTAKLWLIPRICQSSSLFNYCTEWFS